MTPFGNPLTTMVDGYGLAGPFVALGIAIDPLLLKVWVTDPRTVRVTVMVLRVSPCFLSRFFLAPASSAPNAEPNSAPSPPHAAPRPKLRRDMAVLRERLGYSIWS